jgi:hypothetical protein
MKRAALLLVSLSLATVMSVAQATTHSNFAPTFGNQTSATPRHTASEQGTDLRGCLIGAKDEYQLVDHQGKAHNVTGDKQLLSDEVGHEVDMTGRLRSGDTFHETALTDIASRCWNFSMP